MLGIIVNEKITLKILEHKNASDLFRLTDQSRGHLREWLPWVDNVTTSKDSEIFIQSGLNQFAAGDGVQLGIWYCGELAGVIGLHYINWSNRLTSIGYWLGDNFQGNGIMSSACKALIDHVFQEYSLNRVEIRAAAANYKSRAIPERLGFSNEGCIRQAERLYDRYVDHAIYGMLKKDWKH